MNTIAIIGIGITILWVSAIAYYFYVSRQQKELAGEIEELKEELEATESRHNPEQTDYS